MSTAISNSSTAAFDDWLAALPQAEGFPTISAARRFSHEESAYDAQYGMNNEKPSLTEGLGAGELLREHGADVSAPVLEIGCGTGLLSTGLVAANIFPRVLLTDPSPAFLKITRDKIRRAGADESSVRYATLMGEDAALLPESMFSAVVLRSTLHHVIDVPAFIQATARTLLPGGLFVCQEPIAEGYALMGAIASFFPLLAQSAGKPLSKAQLDQVTLFQDTCQMMGRRDIDKSKLEDKHLFRPAEIIQLADQAGMSAEYLPNADVLHFAPGAHRPAPGAYSISAMFHDYLKYCMSFGDSFSWLFAGPLLPHLKRLEHLSMHGAAPCISGIFVCRKRA